MASNEGLLQNLFTKGDKAVSDFGSAGKSSLDQVTKFFQNLLSGNRSDTMKMVAPAANEARSAADATKKERSEKGSSRTGGDIAANASIEDEVRKQIANLVGNLQGGAAGALAGIGESEMNAMLSALGITTGAVQSDVNSQRQASAAMWGSLIGGAGDILGAWIGK